VWAPAGSGKTRLLRAWIGEAGLAERAAWVSVHGEDRDPQRFLLSLAEALRNTVTGSKLVRPLTATPDMDGWAIVEWLLQDLHSLPDRIWLIIDDLHDLRSDRTLRQLELLVMRAPTGLRFVFASRRDPSWACIACGWTGADRDPRRRPPFHPRRVPRPAQRGRDPAA
jgi:LuxR family maltose regulon positive regulatory protein